MVPKRSPWVQMSSAQPWTSRSISAGRASVVRSRSWALGRARRAREEGVAHRATDQVEGLARRGKAARHLLGGFDVGAEPFGHRRGLHPPTVVRPLPFACVDAPRPGPPSARSPWPSQPWSARWEPAAAGAAEQARAAGAAPRPGLPDPVADGRPALVQPRGRRVPQRRGGQQPCRSACPSTGASSTPPICSRRSRARPRATRCCGETGLPVTAGGGGLSAADLRHRGAQLERQRPRHRGRHLRGRLAHTLTLDCQPLKRRVRRRLPRLRRARAPGLVDPGGPLHHLPHLPTADRRVGHGGRPARRRRRPRHGGRPDDHGRRAHRQP